MNHNAPYNELRSYMDLVNKTESTEAKPVSVSDLSGLFDAMYTIRKLLGRLTKAEIVCIDNFHSLRSDSISLVVEKAKKAISQFSILDFDEQIKEELECALSNIKAVKNPDDVLCQHSLQQDLMLIEEYLNNEEELVQFEEQNTAEGQYNKAHLELLIRLGGKALEKLNTEVRIKRV